MMLPVWGSVQAIPRELRARFMDAFLHGCSLEKVVLPPAPSLRSLGVCRDGAGLP